MTNEEFEKLVGEAVDTIPQEFLEKLNNVAIVVEDVPTLQQRVKLRLRHGMSLFGLYEGVSLLRRGAGYTGALPDKITIFKRPMEYFARDNNDLKEIVKHTVWHEIAHHFGMSERQVREAEKTRREQKK
jgi:predicted Zn-dependent protease with MMP-like domain